jgi:hypothetical protein
MALEDMKKKKKYARYVFGSCSSKKRISKALIVPYRLMFHSEGRGTTGRK